MFGLKLKRSKCQAPNDLFGAPCSLPASCFAAQAHGHVAPSADFYRWLLFTPRKAAQRKKEHKGHGGAHWGSAGLMRSQPTASRSPTCLPISLPLPRLSPPPGGLFLTAGHLTSTPNPHWLPSQGSRDKSSTVRPGGTLGPLRSIYVGWEEGYIGAKTSK